MRRTLVLLPVLLMILLAPLEVYSFVLPGEVHLTLYFAFVAALVPLLLIRLRRDYPLPVYLALTFSVWSLCGVLLAGGHWEGYRGLGVQVMDLLTLMYVVTFVRDSRGVQIAITAQIVAGVIAASMGLVEFIAFVFFKTIVHPPFADLSGMEGGGYNFMGELMRMHGFFTASNHLGAFLLLPFGLSFYRALHGAAHRRIYALTSAFLFLTMLMGLARSAYLGIAVILAILGAHWAASFARRIFVAGLAVAVIGFLYLKPDTGFDPLDRANPFHTDERPTGSYTSKELWAEHFQAALVGAVRTGGVGLGVQNFDEWAFQQGLVGVWGSHSDFIMFLGESGVVGFACQLLIVLFVCRSCWRGYKRDRHEGRPPFFLYLLATYLAVVSTGVTRTYYYYPTSFIFIGLIIQAFKFHSPASDGPTTAHRLDAPSPFRSQPVFSATSTAHVCGTGPSLNTSS